MPPSLAACAPARPLPAEPGASRGPIATPFGPARRLEGEALIRAIEGKSLRVDHARARGVHITSRHIESFRPLGAYHLALERSHASGEWRVEGDRLCVRQPGEAPACRHIMIDGAGRFYAIATHLPVEELVPIIVE